MTYALLLAFFRNDMGFGGNNGLTDFKDILGFSVQAPGTRVALFAATVTALAIMFLAARVIVTSTYGKVLVAIRDAESRTRFLGYRVEHHKLVVFVAFRLHGGHRRRALRAAGRHHQSIGVLTGQLHRGRDLGRGGRPRHADRRGRRRRDRQFPQDHVHDRAAGAATGCSRSARSSSSSRWPCRKASSARSTNGWTGGLTGGPRTRTAGLSPQPQAAE